MLFQISNKIIPKTPTDHKLVLVQAMAGLVSSRRQGIIWTNNFPLHWRIYALPCLNVSPLVNVQTYLCKT